MGLIPLKRQSTIHQSWLWTKLVMKIFTTDTNYEKIDNFGQIVLLFDINFK